MEEKKGQIDLINEENVDKYFWFEREDETVDIAHAASKMDSKARQHLQLWGAHLHVC